MTDPILKLDLSGEPPGPPAPRRPSGVLRGVVLGLALGAIFAGVTIAMLLALPAPHTQSDYVIAGGVAAGVTMLGWFSVLLSAQSKVSDSFFKRRPK